MEIATTVDVIVGNLQRVLAPLGVVLLDFRDPSQEGMFPGRFHRPLSVGHCRTREALP